LPETLKNLVAVRAEDKGAQFVKDIIAVIESKDFRNAVEDQKNVFSSFQKPEWYVKKWAGQKLK